MMTDICFILEGTYPYISGGVSTWVHQLIESLPQLKFGLVYIGSHADPTLKMKYVLPHQINFFQEIYLHDYLKEEEKIKEWDEEKTQKIKGYFDELLKGRFNVLELLFSELFHSEISSFEPSFVMHSKSFWNLLIHYYQQYASSLSFIDFFWTLRDSFLPLSQVLSTWVPKAKIYHAVSTGYAGLLAAKLSSQQQSEFFLTEHGIYTYERFLEITQSPWIFDQKPKRLRAETSFGFFKNYWVSFFKMLSQISYYQATKIFTLYEGNKIKQIEDGAKAEKIHIIPNGIKISVLPNTQTTQARQPFTIAFVGRVVPIKDVKTFIMAARICLEQLKEHEEKMKFLILGSIEEDPDYAQDCMEICKSFKVEEYIEFKGYVKPDDYYPQIDVIVLTSISEAQPYVILEANIRGIPVVATQVGACQEMLEGLHPKDKSLGPSGIVTSVGSAEQTAAAILKLYHDPILYKKLSQSGIERVKEFYNQDNLLSKYLNHYESCL